MDISSTKVIDARTKITTELLSEQGYIQGVDEEGMTLRNLHAEKILKKILLQNTNTIFVRLSSSMR